METVYIACAIAAGLSLFVASVVIRYQHECLRAKIVERARRMFTDVSVQMLDDMTEQMMGREIRNLCSLQDAEFRQEVCSRLGL